LESDELLLTEGTWRLTGLDADTELTLEEAIESYHPDDRAAARELLDSAVEQSERVGGTFCLQPTGGETRLLDVTATPVIKNGTTTTLRGLIRDVTHIRRRREDLESERQLVQQALDTLDDVFCVLDVDGRLKRWNDTAAAVTARTDAELDGADVLQFIAEDDREQFADVVETVLTEGEATVEADVLGADGTHIPHEFVGSRLTDSEGNAAGIVGASRDLTERRRRDRRLRALVEKSNDIITIVDADGRYQCESPSVERILGHDPQEKVGESARGSTSNPDDHDRVRETLACATSSLDKCQAAVFTHHLRVSSPISSISMITMPRASTLGTSTQ